MIRTRRAATGALVVGLAVAAIASGMAAAATPTFWLNVHARLAPVAGTKASAGRFSGVLVKNGRVHITPAGTGKVRIAPRSRWQLTWTLSLPPLDGTMTALLRIGSARSPVRIRRGLCAGCATEARGTMTLSARQVARITKADAVVVVRTRSATLRGPVKVSTRIPAPTRR